MDIRNLEPVKRSVSELLGDSPEFLFQMPKFQREYTWEKKHWEKFFADVTNELEYGHFLGSIIGIEPKSAFGEPIVIVIDGQQRLTTISLYFAALYSHIRFYKAFLNEDQQTDLNTIKRKLIQKAPGKKSRVIPQTQNFNYDDYIWLLGDIEVTAEKYEKPEGADNRKIVKAYKFFYDQLKKLLKYEASDADRLAKLFSLSERMMTAIVVIITVKSYSDAYQLFESLNNRGEALNKIDLIKNMLLSRIGDTDHIEEYVYDKWKQIIENIGDTQASQERFFRNNYNAFRKEFNNGDVDYPIAQNATQSNLLDVYEELTENEPKEFIEACAENSKLYAQINLISSEKLPSKIRVALFELNKAEGSTSFVLLMYLFKYQEGLEISDDDIAGIIRALTKFQVRRNMTKMPPTNKMIPFFNEVLSSLDKGEYKGKELVNFLIEKIKAFSASDDDFRESLFEDVYETNKNTTTLMLKMLAYSGMTIESERDLWKTTDDGIPIWTIEHIFPQGATIPDCWVKMIAAGDLEKAKAYQKAYVHKIGNLTITGFNSSLGNKSFIEKRDKKSEEGLITGYKNGLNLNQDLCDLEEWTVEKIQERTIRMADKLIELYTIKA